MSLNTLKLARTIGRDEQSIFTNTIQSDFVKTVHSQGKSAVLDDKLHRNTSNEKILSSSSHCSKTAESRAEASARLSPGALRFGGGTDDRYDGVFGKILGTASGSRTGASRGQVLLTPSGPVVEYSLIINRGSK